MQANYTSACALMHMGAEPQVAVRRAGQTFRVGSIASVSRCPQYVRSASNSGHAGSHPQLPRRRRPLAAFSFAIRSKIAFRRFGVLKLLGARGGALSPLELCR